MTHASRLRLRRDTLLQPTERVQPWPRGAQPARGSAGTGGTARPTIRHEPARRFAAAMAPRPVRAGTAPRLAVSGGADSLALALLARDWARTRGGSALGLVVDHGLRPESGAEAALTMQRLQAQQNSGAPAGA